MQRKKRFFMVHTAVFHGVNCCVAFPVCRTGRRSSFRFHGIRSAAKTSVVVVALTLACSCNDSTKPAAKEAAVKKETASKPANMKTILFFGNSLTAGYGLDDISESFPS